MKKKPMAALAFYLPRTLVAIVFILPLLWMVSASFKPETEIFHDLTSLTTFFPLDFTLENYKSVFQRISMGRYVLNSLVYVSVLVAFDLLVNSMCGYALSKLRFRGRGLISLIVICFMALPIESIILPLYIQVSSYGWADTKIALIVPFVMKCFSIYMFKQYFMDVPDELLEAAAMDGCSPMMTYWRIVVPISKPIFCTIFILDFVEHWNDFMWPMLITTGESNRTVQLGIQMFFGSKPIQYGPIMAALTISAIPMVVLFMAFQKYYIQGIASTGIKE